GIGEPLTRLLDVVAGVVIGGAGGETAIDQRLVTLEIALGILEIGLGSGNVGARALHLGGGLGDLHLGGANLRLGIGERDAIGPGIDTEEHVAAVDDLVFAHQHLDDGAGHLGGDGHHVALDIGVVGG